MTKNSALTTFLMISVIVILMGIAMVIVTQFDNHQSTHVFPASFDQEQTNIFEQVYKIRASQAAPASRQKNEAPRNPESAPLSNEVVQSLQAQVDNYRPRVIPAPDFDTAYNGWSANPQQVVEPYYSLKNNPWSPEYQPGY